MTTSEIYERLCEVENNLEQTISFVKTLKEDLNEQFKLATKNIQDVSIEDFFSLKYDFTYPQNTSIINVMKHLNINNVYDLCNNSWFKSFDDLRRFYGIGKTKIAAIKIHMERYGLAFSKQEDSQH